MRQILVCCSAAYVRSPRDGRRELARLTQFGYIEDVGRVELVPTEENICRALECPWTDEAVLGGVGPSTERTTRSVPQSRRP